MNRMHAIKMKSLIVPAPHGVVSNTPLRAVHKSLNGILIVICPGLAPVVRRHMTLDVAGASSSLGVNEPSF